MDRFIGVPFQVHLLHQCHLKSNMDRFIVKLADTTSSLLPYLKSNMDRFIDNFQY